jgi:hypothetical protein
VSVLWAVPLHHSFPTLDGTGNIVLFCGFPRPLFDDFRRILPVQNGRTEKLMTHDILYPYNVTFVR